MLSALATASESGLNLSGISFRVDLLRALDLLIRAIAPSDVILGLRYRWNSKLFTLLQRL